MKLPTYQFVAQMTAALAVAASLVLVAYELKLSRDLGMATLVQESAANKMQYMAANTQYQPLNEAYFQARKDPLLMTEEQVQRIMWEWDGWMIDLQAQFIQVELGLLDDYEWEANQKTIAGYGHFQCYTNRFMAGEGFQWRSDFRAEVEKLWADLPVQPCHIERFNYEGETALR